MAVQLKLYNIQLLHITKIFSMLSKLNVAIYAGMTKNITVWNKASQIKSLEKRHPQINGICTHFSRALQSSHTTYRRLEHNTNHKRFPILVHLKDRVTDTSLLISFFNHVNLLFFSVIYFGHSFLHFCYYLLLTLIPQLGQACPREGSRYFENIL